MSDWRLQAVVNKVAGSYPTRPSPPSQKKQPSLRVHFFLRHFKVRWHLDNAGSVMRLHPGIPVRKSSWGAFTKWLRLFVRIQLGETMLLEGITPPKIVGLEITDCPRNMEIIWSLVGHHLSEVIFFFSYAEGNHHIDFKQKQRQNLLQVYSLYEIFQQSRGEGFPSKRSSNVIIGWKMH